MHFDPILDEKIPKSIQWHLVQILCYLLIHTCNFCSLSTFFPRPLSLRRIMPFYQDLVYRDFKAFFDIIGNCDPDPNHTVYIWDSGPTRIGEQLRLLRAWFTAVAGHDLRILRPGLIQYGYHDPPCYGIYLRTVLHKSDTQGDVLQAWVSPLERSGDCYLVRSCRMLPANMLTHSKPTTDDLQSTVTRERNGTEILQSSLTIEKLIRLVDPPYISPLASVEASLCINFGATELQWSVQIYSNAKSYLLDIEDSHASCKAYVNPSDLNKLQRDSSQGSILIDSVQVLYYNYYHHDHRCDTSHRLEQLGYDFDGLPSYLTELSLNLWLPLLTDKLAHWKEKIAEIRGISDCDILKAIFSRIVFSHPPFWDPPFVQKFRNDLGQIETPFSGEIKPVIEVMCAATGMLAHDHHQNTVDQAQSPLLLWIQCDDWDTVSSKPSMSIAKGLHETWS